MPVEGYARVDLITSSELIVFVNQYNNNWSQNIGLFNSVIYCVFLNIKVTDIR